MNNSEDAYGSINKRTHPENALDDMSQSTVKMEKDSAKSRASSAVVRYGEVDGIIHPEKMKLVDNDRADFGTLDASFKSIGG